MSKSEITIDDGKYTIRTGKIKTVFRTPEDAAVMIALCHDDIERLATERNTLLACRRGDQRCHECPDTGCADNMRESAELTRLREENADLRMQLIDAGVWEEEP